MALGHFILSPFSHQVTFGTPLGQWLSWKNPTLIHSSTFFLDLYSLASSELTSQQILFTVVQLVTSAFLLAAPMNFLARLLEIFYFVLVRILQIPKETTTSYLGPLWAMFELLWFQQLAHLGLSQFSSDFGNFEAVQTINNFINLRESSRQCYNKC